MHAARRTIPRGPDRRRSVANCFMSSVTFLRKSSVGHCAARDADDRELARQQLRLAPGCRARGSACAWSRSPAAPKITMTHGSPGFADAAVPWWRAWSQSGHSSFLSLVLNRCATTRYAGFLTACGSTCPPNFWRMAESTSPRTCAPGASGSGRNSAAVSTSAGHRFVDRRLDRPAAFAGILHEAAVFGERRDFRPAPWRSDRAATN